MCSWLWDVYGLADALRVEDAAVGTVEARPAQVEAARSQPILQQLVIRELLADQVAQGGWGQWALERGDSNIYWSQQLAVWLTTAEVAS